MSVLVLVIICLLSGSHGQTVGDGMLLSKREILQKEDNQTSSKSGEISLNFIYFVSLINHIWV